MQNYYAWNPNHLRHLSAGAVIKNDEDEILVHKLERIGNKYFLPKKTLLPFGSPEQAVMATTLETGWKIEILDYLGSIQSTFPVQEGEKTLTVAKTTLYFHCKPLYEVGRDSEDRDADTTLHWVDIKELIDIFREQGQQEAENDLDQSEILMTLLN